MRQEENGLYTCEHCCIVGDKLIHDHSFRPYFLHQKMAWENTRYLGIELEIEIRGNNDNRLLAAENIKNWLSQQPKTMDVKLKNGKVLSGKTLDKLLYIKSDGSLKNGLELVWHPFTLKSFHKNFPLRQFLDFLSSNRGTIDSTCGMHIHVSKEKLSREDLLKGKWFFHKCQPYLKRFSERTDFGFCKFDPYPPHPDPYRQEYGHYSVLNIASQSAKTLEVRIFKGTLDYKKFIANIQFSDVFVDYIQHGAGSAFLRRATPAVVWQNFIDYAKSKNQYQIMTSWILTRAIV